MATPRERRAGSRKEIPPKVQEAVLIASRRRCCLCWWLDSNDAVIEGQIAHIDRDHANAARENLVFLCHRHHDWYDSKPSQEVGRTEGELRHASRELDAHFADIRTGDAAVKGTSNPAPAGQASPPLTPSTVFDQRGSIVLGNSTNIAGDATIYHHAKATATRTGKKQMAVKSAQPSSRKAPKNTGELKRGRSGPGAGKQSGEGPPKENPLASAIQVGSNGRLFVVFLRIVGLKDMKAEVNAGCQSALLKFAEEHAGTADIAVVHHQSSVYGRILFVREAVHAIDVAVAFLRGAAKQGVRLALGVSVGRIESTDDFGRRALAGPPISNAARLAHLTDSDDAIAVDAAVYGEFQESKRSEEVKFSEQQEGKVKKTPLLYRWLMVSAGKRRHHPPEVSYTGPRSAFVIVFDLAGFSQKNADGQWEVVAKLRRQAIKVLAAQNLGASAASGQLWYAPAGDGGVWVFSQELGAAAAMLAAQQLAALCADYVDLRVSVATGLVVIVGDGLPTGTGVLNADALCSLPQAGEIAVSKVFWEKSLESQPPPGWTMRLLPDHPEAVILAPNGGSGEATNPGNPPPKGGPPPPEGLLRQALRKNLKTLLSKNPSLCNELVEVMRTPGTQRQADIEFFLDLILEVGMAGTLARLHRWLEDSRDRKDSEQIRRLVDGLAPLAVRNQEWLDQERRALEQLGQNRPHTVPVHSSTDACSAELVVAALLDRTAQFEKPGSGTGHIPFPSPQHSATTSDRPERVIEAFLRDLMAICKPDHPPDRPPDLRWLRSHLQGLRDGLEPKYVLFRKGEDSLQRELERKLGGNGLSVLLLKPTEDADATIEDPPRLSASLNLLLKRLEAGR